MNVKDILGKVAKGEALTDDEKAFVASYDPEQATNAAAAAARKKAEAEADKARKDLEALTVRLTDAETRLQDAAGKGKTDLEKLTQQVGTLTQQVQAAQAEKAKLIRQQKLDDVIRKTGVAFVKEVDGGIMRQALINEFGNLTDEDLADDAKTKPVLETFKARNKAVIVAEGYGSGGTPHTPKVSTGLSGKPVDQMSPAEREADLKKRGIL